jgi:hypothetical protein
MTALNLRWKLVLSTTIVAAAASISSLPATATEMSPAVLSDCPSGSFCVWTGTGFSGTMQKISATNSYRSITLSSTKSFYNHRSQRSWLHATPDGSGASTCVEPGASRASTSGWQATAESVYLATITDC